jgi:lipopolysaccharide assembly protein A
MRLINIIVFFFIVLLGVSFACLNAEPVMVNYYVGSGKLPLSLLLVLALGAGILLGLLVALKLAMKHKIEVGRLNSRIKVAEKEVANLRAIPIKDEH